MMKLAELPEQIEEANYKLMLATMNVCYSRIKQNTQDIENINQWIQNFRDTVKTSGAFETAERNME